MTAQPDTAPHAHRRSAVPVAARRALAVVAWASLIVFVVLSIGLPLIGIGTFMGTDILFRFAPWASAGGSSEVGTNAMIGDTIDSGVPQMWTIVEAARHGVFAEWLPYQAGGSELGGLPNSGLYSPISFGWWFLPVAVAPGFTKLVEMIVVTLGCALLLRRLGVPHPAWPIASVIFLSSGFMISWTNWPQTRVAAFIPLLFWALDRAAVRRRLLDAVPLGLVLASMLLGGFPAIVGYALYAGAAYVLVRAIIVHRRFWKVVLAGLVSALGVVLGFLLSAWTLLPFALNAVAVLDFSGRRQGPENHLSVADLLSAFVPGLVGEVSTGDTWGSSSPVERLSYVGAVAVVLALLAVLVRPWRRGRRDMSVFLVVGLLVSAVLVYLGGPVLGAAQQLPIFDSNRIGRLRVMLGFFVAILAAVGFARLLDRAGPEPVGGGAPPPTTTPQAVAVGPGDARFGTRRRGAPRSRAAARRHVRAGAVRRPARDTGARHGRAPRRRRGPRHRGPRHSAGDDPCHRALFRPVARDRAGGRRRRHLVAEIGCSECVPGDADHHVPGAEPR
jgi:hypothetical protein